MARFLAPIDALTAASYSILIVLTFTLAFSVVKRTSGYGAPVASEEKRHLLYEDVLDHLRDSEPRPVGFQRSNLIEALGYTLVALIAALPSLAPLWLLRNDPLLALRASNIVSFIMLFVLGYRWGRYTGANPWKIGALLVFAGVLLMAIAIPLGG